MARTHSLLARLQANYVFVTLAVLLIATFLLGGGARDDIASLPVLRPLAVLCLGIGLFDLNRNHLSAYRMPLGFMAAILLLIALHLVPLPPAIWTAIPGRELAVQAGEAVGGPQPWRPLALVPYRGWNALFATLVPAAAMVLAAQLPIEGLRKVLYLFVGFALANAIWGVVQSVAGFEPGLYFYRVTNSGVPTGLFANRNHMAALLVTAIPLLTLVATRAKGSTQRVLQIGCAALAALCFLMIFAAGSRAGLLLAMVAIASSALIWRAKPDAIAKPRRGVRSLLPLALAGAGAIAIACFAYITSRATAIDRVLASDEAEEGRIIVWQTLVDILPQYLPFGSGIGSFVEIFNVHEPNAMLGLNYWNHAHNDWLEWALEGGVPAIALMLAAIAAWALRTRSLLSYSYSGRLDIQLGLVGAIVILVLGLWSVVDYPLRVPSLACLIAMAVIWMAAPRAGKLQKSGS